MGELFRTLYMDDAIFCDVTYEDCIYLDPCCLWSNGTCWRSDEATAYLCRSSKLSYYPYRGYGSIAMASIFTLIFLCIGILAIYTFSVPVAVVAVGGRQQTDMNEPFITENEKKSTDDQEVKLDE